MMTRMEKKRKRGRPPGIPNPGTGRPAVLKKPVRVALRLDGAVYDALAKRADAAGGTVTDELRAAAQERAKKG